MRLPLTLWIWNIEQIFWLIKFPMFNWVTIKTWMIYKRTYITIFLPTKFSLNKRNSFRGQWRILNWVKAMWGRVKAVKKLLTVINLYEIIVFKLTSYSPSHIFDSLVNTPLEVTGSFVFFKPIIDDSLKTKQVKPDWWKQTSFRLKRRACKEIFIYIQ